jgi:DNA mismatch repair protein MutH
MEDGPIEDVQKIKTIPELIRRAKWLEGKTLSEITDIIRGTDHASRVLTKGDVGYVIEKGFFGIDKNSDARPDIPHLGVEIKTCPLKKRKDGSINVKEPLSLGIINYMEEYKYGDIKKSPLYQKNHKILLVCYIHDKEVLRSEYVIKYVFLLELTDEVIEKIREDYNKIIEKIKEGKAEEIHQGQNKYLTLCPKHNGKFKNISTSDPRYLKSIRPQPFSKKDAEIRAFRFKNKYMNELISKGIHKKLEKNGWKD